MTRKARIAANLACASVHMRLAGTQLCRGLAQYRNALFTLLGLRENSLPLTSQFAFIRSTVNRADLWGISPIFFLSPPSDNTAMTSKHIMHDLTPLRFFGNLFIGAATVAGSLTLPELAATLSGLGGFAWFMVQIWVTLKRDRCKSQGCPNRQS